MSFHLLNDLFRSHELTFVHNPNLHRCLLDAKKLYKTLRDYFRSVIKRLNSMLNKNTQVQELIEIESMLRHYQNRINPFSQVLILPNEKRSSLCEETFQRLQFFIETSIELRRVIQNLLVDSTTFGRRQSSLDFEPRVETNPKFYENGGILYRRKVVKDCEHTCQASHHRLHPPPTPPTPKSMAN